MNRLGKPEHRARFCFFSKKKSPAGTRRFPITLEIQIPMGFNRSATVRFQTSGFAAIRGFPGFASLALPGANPQSKNPFRVHPFTCMPSKPESA